MSNVVSLSSFSGENDHALFANAMAYLREHPNTTLVVEPRVYDIGTPLSRKTMEDVISGVYGNNPEGAMFSPDFAYSSGVSLEGQSGTTVIADGATLMIDGFMEPLTLLNCENITVKGLTIDHKRKPYSQGIISELKWRSKAEGTGSFIVTFGEEFPTCESTPMPRYIAYDPYANRQVYYGEYRVMRREYLGDNRWKFSFKNLKHDLTGMEFYVWHTFHYRPAILIENAVNTILENVTIHSQPGMGIVAHRDTDIRISGLRVVPSTGNHMSTNTDATHFTSCKGTVRVENSVFEGQGDDSINIHTFYHSIDKTGDCTCTTYLQAPGKTHSQTADYPDPGDILELTDMNSLSVVDTYRVISREATESPWKSKLVLDKPLPADCTDLAFANATQMPRLEFVGNFCRSHIARSVLVKIKDALIEDNTIMDVVGTGIYIAAEAWWFEGLCTTENIEIRRNRIVHCGRMGNAARPRGCAGICVTIDANNPTAATHKHVVIEDNIVDCPESPHGVYVSNAVEAIVRRNHITSSDEPVVVEPVPTRK